MGLLSDIFGFIDDLTSGGSYYKENSIEWCDKARHGDGAAYLRLADCYRTGNGVKRDFFNMITMAQMTELYGYHIDDYINGLPDDDEYKTLFTTMDRYHACSEDSVISVIKKNLAHDKI